MNKLLVIDTSMVKTIINDDRFLKEFPAFKTARKSLNYKPPKAGCSRCQKRRLNQQKDRVINEVLLTISKFNANDRKKLKKLLNTEKAQIRLTTNNNKKINLTF